MRLTATGVVLVVLVSGAGRAQDSAQQPTFHAGVDLIRLDVPVVDKNHHPVHGLTAADFTVKENGTVERIVGVTEVDVPPPSSAPVWTRHVPPDVMTTGLAEAVGSDRLFAIVLDDATIAIDPNQNAARAAREVVAHLGPADVAAVIFTRATQASQDFTTDRSKLYDAIALFTPQGPSLDQLMRQPDAAGGNPIRRRGSRDEGPAAGPACIRFHPGISTLDTLVRLLGRVPERRRTIVDITTGEVLDFSAGIRTCDYDLNQAIKEVFHQAQLSNVTIDTIDPSGPGGLEITGRELWASMEELNRLHRIAALARQYDEIVADNTGGLSSVVLQDTGVDAIFDETSSYYLVGYQTSNAQADGGYRRVEIHVNRADVTAQAEHGYYGAPPSGKPAAFDNGGASTELRQTLSGLQTNTSLPLRVSVVPFAAAGGSGSDALVLVGVREPSPRQPLKETVTLVTTSADSDVQPFAMRQDVVSQPIAPGPTTDLEYEFTADFPLGPGRYSLQFRAHSATLDRGGTIYEAVEVPDFARAPVSLSGVIVTLPVSDGRVIQPSSDPRLPSGATTERMFGPGQHFGAYLRAYQGGSGAIAPLAVRVQIIDAADEATYTGDTPLDTSRFGTARSADIRLDLAADDHPGPHLLRIVATLPDGSSARRDVTFAVR